MGKHCRVGIKFLFVGMLFIGKGSLCKVYQGEESLVQLDSKKTLALYQTMKDVHELFVEFDINYWLDGGTLIGAIRHKGLIAWDDDLDVLIDSKDEPKLLAIVPLIEKLGYRFYTKYGDWKIDGPGGTLDILLMTLSDGAWYYTNERHKWRWGKRDEKPLHYYDYELFPLKEYTFGSITVYGPHDPYPYLNSIYGDTWQDYAKFKNDNRYELVKLTDKLKQPGLPIGPLVDRVQNMLNEEETTERL